MGRSSLHLFEATLQGALLFLIVFNHGLLIIEANWCSNAKFFGPNCAYENRIVDNSTEYTLDGTLWEQSSACNSLSSQQQKVTFKFNDIVCLYWIRVEVVNESSTSNVSFSLRSNDSELISQHEKRYVTGKVVDIHFDFIGNVSYVIIKASINSVCDVYISKGKQIADNYKELAFSTDHPENCIDHNKETVCSANGQILPVFWQLKIPDPAYIFEYNIEIDENYKQKAAGNVVRFMDEKNEVIWSHRDNETTGHTYYSETVSLKDVRSFEVSVDKHRRGTSAVVLSLAEVSLMGDYNCTGNFFGKLCDIPCNCAEENEKCFSATGGCSSGCATGFKGMDCMDKCDNFTFGPSCNGRCDGCLHACNTLTGTCSDCKPGYIGPRCNETCPTGTYGNGCMPCPKICDMFCDPHTGRCTGSCAPGWRGENCEKHCLDLSWGKGCANHCSSDCAGGGKCDSANGHCKEGCKTKGRGPRCEAMVLSSFVSVASFLAFLLFISVFLVCAVFFIRKRKQTPRKQQEEN